jgi:outer membrane protein
MRRRNKNLSESHRRMRMSSTLQMILRALVLGLVSAVPAYAETLTWQASVRESAANNAELRAARANLDAAGYNASAAYGGLYPQVSAGVGYTDTSGTTSSGSSTIGSTTYVGKTYNASVSASQNLFAGFRDSARIDQGAANRDVAAASLALAKARVSQALKSAFAGLKFAQDSVTLAASIVQRQEENVRLVELRFESGRENKGSMLLTRASLAQARLSQLQAGQALVTARARFAQALGRSDAGELEVRGDVPTVEPAQTPDFRRIALQAPDYFQASAQEKSASAGVTLARAGLYPSLDLSGSVGHLGSDWFPEDERRSVGLNLTVPIFSGGRDYYTTRGAAASLDAASSNKQTIERQLLVNLNQAYAGYVQAVEQLKVNQAFLDAAQVRAEIARSQYNNGLISFNDWNLIETDLIQRQTSYLQSQRDRIVTEASWEQAQGKGVIP